MKRTFTKLFMLSAALLLSAATFAQDEIQHRYPAIPYTYNGRSYEMPAWDIKITADKDIRVQTIAPLPTTADGHFKGKIVARRTFSKEANNYGSPLFASSPSNVTIGGLTFAEAKAQYDPDNAKLTSWQYGLACDVLGIEIADEARSIEIFGLTAKSGTDYTIPSTYTVSNTSSSETYRGRTFDIVEIGVGAFRNYTTNNLNVFSITGTLTIPNTITSIEHNAFRHCVFKKVVFQEGSTLKTIENAVFEGCKNLEEVNIPASVTTIKGTAFGSCEKLSKIVFEGDVPEMTKEDEEPEYPKASTYPGPYSVFEGATRFQVGTTPTAGPDLTPAKCIIEVPFGTAKSYVEANDGILGDFVLSSKFPLTTSSGMMTYCSDLDFTFKQYNTADKSWSAGGMQAFYVLEDNIDIDNGKLILTEITDDVMVPGWTSTDDFGVVLRGTGADNEDGTYNIFYPNTPNSNMTSKLSMEGTGNCLYGVIESTPIDVVSHPKNSYFILTGGKFQRVTENGNCKANRAYIMIADGGYDGTVPVPGDDTGAKSLSIEFSDATGIVNHETKSAQSDAFYNLQGVQVKQPQKGIFIKNGKKFVIK